MLTFCTCCAVWCSLQGDFNRALTQLWWAREPVKRCLGLFPQLLPEGLRLKYAVLSAQRCSTAEHADNAACIVPERRTQCTCRNCLELHLLTPCKRSFPT